MLHFHNFKTFSISVWSLRQKLLPGAAGWERDRMLFFFLFCCTWDPASVSLSWNEYRQSRDSNRANSAFTEVWVLRYANPVSNNYRLFRNGNQIRSKCAGASRHAPPSHTFVSVTLFFSLDTHNTLPGTRPTHQGTSDIIFVYFKIHISMIFL